MIVSMVCYVWLRLHQFKNQRQTIYWYHVLKYKTWTFYICSKFLISRRRKRSLRVSDGNLSVINFLILSVHVNNITKLLYMLLILYFTDNLMKIVHKGVKILHIGRRIDSIVSLSMSLTEGFNEFLDLKLKKGTKKFVLLWIIHIISSVLPFKFWFLQTVTK